MARRKTIEVKRLVEMANEALDKSKDSEKGVRWGIIGLVERVLHETDNYRGFSYRSDQFERTEVMGEAAVKFIERHDETRRFYYCKEN